MRGTSRSRLHRYKLVRQARMPTAPSCFASRLGSSRPKPTYGRSRAFLQAAVAISGSVGFVNHNRTYDAQLDVQVALDLMGLDLPGSVDAPKGTSFERTTKTWEVSTLHTGYILRVPDRVSSVKHIPEPALPERDID